jgi:phosphoribosylaminoimidazolecarboxamide formyltransferase/IMP cyclohydrolase
MARPIHRALLSVSDKAGLENFARQLHDYGVELLSTGGTYKALDAAGIPVVEVSSHTGFPEMMDGRVKTLHPMIHGGILAVRDNTDHAAAMDEHAISPIDLVVVNLYPFEETIAKEGSTRAECVEQIDIGGPSMVRSAAKNHKFVSIVTEPEQYSEVLGEMQSHDGGMTLEFRRVLAQKAFARTAAYDAAVASWLFAQDRGDASEDASPFPDSVASAGKKVLDLRYGENPHQAAAFYSTDPVQEPCVAHSEVLSGKALSFNNLVDLDAAHALAAEFEEPFVAVIKHTNPCGAAVGSTISEALERAWSGDSLSAFGSVLAFTRPVDLASAKFLVEGNRFVEAIVAPDFDDDAFEHLTQKPKWGKNVRLLSCGAFGPSLREEGGLEWKRLTGGFLVQDRDLTAETAFDGVSEAKASSAQLEELAFANRIAKHVKSNAIVLTSERTVVGVGAGQMSRVDSVRLAAHKAGDRAAGSVLASDAFFPFPDGVEAAIDAGITAIVQPGGSRRDDEVIAAANAKNVPMVFSGVRHFKH